MLQNPIEPSNDLYEHVHVPDSRIDSYIPPYWPFSKSSPVVQDVFPVQNSNPYRPKNPLYAVPIFEPDFGYSHQQDHAVPHRLSPEDNYKSYLSSPLSNAAYLQPSNNEPNVAIQLLGTTNIFNGFGISPTYQTVADIIKREEDSPISPDVAESIPKMFKESPTVIIVAMSPEELHSAQESTYTELVTESSERSPEISPGIKELLDEFNGLNSTKVSMEETVDSDVQDVSDNGTKDSFVFEENSTVEYESTSSTMAEDPLSDEELASLTIAKDPLSDEESTSSTMAEDSTATEDDSNALPTEEESNVVETTEGNPTEYEISSFPTEPKSIDVRFLVERIKKHLDLNQKRMKTVDNISAEFPFDVAVDEIRMAHRIPRILR